MEVVGFCETSGQTFTAKQAREINNYQKTKQKLLKAKAAI
jgi:hypothetical protein